MKIPSPQYVGLPEKFPKWRSGQEEAIELCLENPKRATVLSAPTGSGKTISYVAAALLSKLPTVIVTESKGLQNQLMQDFSEIGMVDIRGRKNYQCDLKPDYTCEEGHAARCPYKGTIGCPSSKAEMAAASSNLVVTNYAKWCASKKYGQGMQHFQQVIFDECHSAPHALASAMQVVLNHKEIEEGLKIPFPAASTAVDFPNWKPWASAAKVIAEAAMITAQARITGISDPKPSWVKHYTHMRNLMRRLATLATANPREWIVEEVEAGYQFDPIRPGKYAEAALLFRIPKIIAVSATIRPKTMYMIGIGKDNFEFKEFDSSFDRKRCPIYYIPTMRVDARNPDLRMLWVKLDQIAAKRRDRKGLVHTISYTRRDDILNTSRFASSMIINPKGEPTADTIEQYIDSPPGTILVSPSMGTGYDFAGKTCEWQFICKIPFEPPSKIVKAREADDKEYRAYQAMQGLVQMCGRPMRCFDRETELLTTAGWKKWNEVKVGDTAFGIPKEVWSQKKQISRDSVALSLNPVLRVFSSEKPEVMITVQAQGVDLAVTPDHEMVIQMRRTATYEKNESKPYGNYKYKIQHIKKSAGLVKVNASNLPARFKLPLAGSINTKGTNIGGSLYTSKLWMKLIGLLVSEGWFSKTGSTVTLYQSKPHGVEAIDYLLSRLHFSPKRYTEDTAGTTMRVGDGKEYTRNYDSVSWVFSGTEAAKIRDIFTSGQVRRYSDTRKYRKKTHKGVDGWKDTERVIPDWVLSRCSRSQLRAIIAGMMLGDGSWNGISGSYYTSELRIADSFQAMCALSGYRTGIRQRRGQYEVQISDIGTTDCNSDTVSQLSGKHKPWCVNTELGTVVIRRKGYVYISGNSKEDQAETFICDDHLQWFLPKYAHLAPRSFHGFFNQVSIVPAPPPRLP